MEKNNVIKLIDGAKRLRKQDRFKDHWAHIAEVIAFDNVKQSLERRKQIKIG